MYAHHDGVASMYISLIDIDICCFLWFFEFFWFSFLVVVGVFWGVGLVLCLVLAAWFDFLVILEYLFFYFPTQQRFFWPPLCDCTVYHSL